MEKWLSSYNKENSPAYIIKNFPDWTAANLIGSSTIYSKAMIPRVHLSSACSFANDISDHYPVFLSCNKNLSDGYNKP
ncbi:hypothetical protein H8356DRAFT_1363311 [Neocallimastix lanati (nom. inval.)]|nr:hypothetical protein H8356DRAFT_1363311 [Neocallimastix sp. JGI-2020a]